MGAMLSISHFSIFAPTHLFPTNRIPKDTGGNIGNCHLIPVETKDTAGDSTFFHRLSFLKYSAEWNKKRKLQGEQLGMPSPKHKFRDRCCGAEIKSPTTDDKEAEDNIHDCPIEDETNGGAGDRIEGCESVKDSNSFIEESDTATMPVDSEDKPNTEIGTNYVDWLSISSSSSSIKNYRSNCNFPASIANKSGEESTHVCIEPNPAILGDDLQLGGGIPSSEDHLDELGMNYYDFIHSEYKNDGKEHSTEIAAEELMLYSNDVPSNLYVLSSGRWSVGPDARLSARKPTIDQEFEQYFSTLML